MGQPLFLKPVFQEKIWGGTKLKTIFDYDITSQQTGECWAISAHPHGTCEIINGKLKGKKLDEVWQDYPALFGHPEEAVFPLLTKIIDANDDLSVQVHPDDAYAMANEGELGKTECWYVLQADPGAEIVYGHHAQTREELKEMIKKGKWKKLLKRVKVKKGDFIFVPSGTIHAIGKGLMILETQQSSDTTYRVYDYNRKDDQGNFRDLHIQQSIDVTTVPFVEPRLHISQEIEKASSVTTFIKTDFFNVYEWHVEGILRFKRQAPYTLVSVLDGYGHIYVNDQAKGFELTKGTHFILPNDIKNWRIEGDLQIIASEPGAASN
ncbi:mannose-6-phosphate isomerase, class I [Vagococcus acidifermentans]|uniref:Mannose-6-phosphate isomerase n=1 Tax=Vagococcus acidifermentans TaxID=564710 RepID=A0A430B0U2_9ENTE|nr:mannose-6-phosphate isomerase, class I [Vagococcus acidifermentans]RSU13832.1 mannose-6-phosphate isomerase, class I [Vagococcus acidifermentans]